jgi:hypothetical protein
VAASCATIATAPLIINDGRSWRSEMITAPFTTIASNQKPSRHRSMSAAAPQHLPSAHFAVASPNQSLSATLQRDCDNRADHV